jgi:hypothetical protein
MPHGFSGELNCHKVSSLLVAVARQNFGTVQALVEAGGSREPYSWQAETTNIYIYIYTCLKAVKTGRLKFRGMPCGPPSTLNNLKDFICNCEKCSYFLCKIKVWRSC